MELINIIKALQDTQGTKAKQAILDSHRENHLLKAYMKAVYDPAVNYYMTKMPKITPGNTEFALRHIQGLQELSERIYTGRRANEYMLGLLSALNAEGQELMGYIIKRSIGGSVGEGMVLNTYPGLFFVPPYMRCAGMDEKAIETYDALPYFYVQTKMDGQFAYCHKDRCGRTTLFSRNGSFYPAYVAEKLAKGLPMGSVVMGELLVYRDGVVMSRKDGNGILNSLLSGDGKKAALPCDEIVLVAWDMISSDEFYQNQSGIDYEDRLSNLFKTIANTAVDIEPVHHTVVKSVAEANKLTKEAYARGEEGTVWKNPWGTWRDSSSGTRDAIKVKAVFEAEFRVTGKYEGTGKAKGMLGGFNIETECGLVKGNVGSGFDDDQRKEFWEADTTNWIVCLEANDVVTKKGRDTESLFLPIFKERRMDKTVADTREQVLKALAAVRAGE